MFEKTDIEQQGTNRHAIERCRQWYRCCVKYQWISQRLYYHIIWHANSSENPIRLIGALIMVMISNCLGRIWETFACTVFVIFIIKSNGRRITASTATVALKIYAPLISLVFYPFVSFYSSVIADCCTNTILSSLLIVSIVENLTPRRVTCY